MSGCATFGQMDRALNSLLGEPIKEAFNALGYPDGKQEFDGDVVYLWGVERSGSISLPQTNTIYGNIGTTPVSAQYTENQNIPINYSCQIKVVADSIGKIKTYDYSGNMGGCEPYIKRLNRYYNSRHQTSDIAIEQYKQLDENKPSSGFDINEDPGKNKLTFGTTP
jgi:hypothetical protein